MDFVLDLPVQVYKVPAGEHFSVGDLCDGKIFGTEFQKREKKNKILALFLSLASLFWWTSQRVDTSPHVILEMDNFN